jgi:hypothetical protein
MLEYTKWFGASKLKKLTLTKAAGPPPSRSGPTGVKAHVARPHTALKVPTGVAALAARPSNPDGAAFGARQGLQLLHFSAQPEPILFPKLTIISHEECSFS